MKYAMESLDYALDKLLPDITKVKEGGVHTDRPSLIKMVAYRNFLGQDVDTNLRAYYTHIVWEAAMDLEVLGFMEFGTQQVEGVGSK